MFSYELCEISTNTFFYRTPPVAASDNVPFALHTPDYSTATGYRLTDYSQQILNKCFRDFVYSFTWLLFKISLMVV